MPTAAEKVFKITPFAGNSGSVITRRFPTRERIRLWYKISGTSCWRVTYGPDNKRRAYVLESEMIVR